MRKAVLSAAHYSKGGINEWLDVDSDEFLLWLDDLKDLLKESGRG